MKKLNLYLIAALLLLVGCYTDRKANRQGEHLFQAKPLIAAKLADKYYPINIISRDTTINYIDSLFTVECPPDLPENDSADYGEIYVKHDTTRLRGKTHYVQVPVRIPYPVITVNKEDSARNVVLQGKIDVLTIEKAKLQGKNSLYNKLFISFLILFILSLVGNILQLKKII